MHSTGPSGQSRGTPVGRLGSLPAVSCFGEPGEEALALLAQPTAVKQSHLNSRFKRCERICETELQQVKSACEFAGCSLLVRSLRRGCSWPGGMLCRACAVVRAWMVLGDGQGELELCLSLQLL